MADTRAVKPGQKLLGKNGFHWRSARIIAVADSGTLIAHWVGLSTVWDERLKLEQVRIGGENDLEGSFGFTQKDERELVSVRKPDRGAVFETGMRFLCDTDGLWLPVEIVRKVGPDKVLVHWVSFDSRFDETVPSSRLRLPVEEQPSGMHKEPPPGEGVTLLTDLNEKSAILYRRGFEWTPVRGVAAVGIDHIEFDDPAFAGHRRKVKRSELRVQTEE